LKNGEELHNKLLPEDSSGLPLLFSSTYRTTSLLFQVEYN
jgi:hypothetical protein